MISTSGALGRRALLLQRDPLVHAEPVLLVDDGEGEVGEPHALLDQRVGADHQVDGPVGDRRKDPLAVLPGDRAGEQTRT